MRPDYQLDHRFCAGQPGLRRRCGIAIAVQREPISPLVLLLCLGCLLLALSPSVWSAEAASRATADASRDAQAYPDGDKLVRDSLKASEVNWRIAENYTWREMRIFRQLDKDGNVTKQESKSYDVTIIDGKEYERLIGKDGEALSAKEEQKEQEKLDKAIAKLQGESPSQREKRLRKDREEKEEREAMFRAIPDAYDMKVIGEDEVEGREAWVLFATPRPDFKPFNRPTSWLSKMEGKLWIDKKRLIWLRAEIETLETLTFGWVLARVGKGSTMAFEQQLVNGEVWVPRRTEVHFDARLALLKKLRGTAETLYSDYKKFSSDSQIVSTTLADESDQ